jgi:hypothetical protein
VDGSDGAGREPDAGRPGGDALIPTAVAADGLGVGLSSGADPELRRQLMATMAQLHELDGRLDQSERRNAQLEAFMSRYAPAPPAPAPR